MFSSWQAVEVLAGFGTPLVRFNERGVDLHHEQRPAMLGWLMSEPRVCQEL